jgi:hypothetical protein
VRVRLGWSGETAATTWQKVDIQLEQVDLERLFVENGMAAEINTRLPTRVCYQLLQNEAERLLLSKLTTFGYPSDKASARAAVLAGQSAEIIDQIQKKLAVS